MSEVYTRKFTGYYSEGSREEARVRLHERGGELAEEIAAHEALHAQHMHDLLEIYNKLQTIEDSAARESLEANRAWLLLGRDALAKKIVALRKQQNQHIYDTQTMAGMLSHNHDFVHNLHYTRVNPELMITEEEMYEDLVEQAPASLAELRQEIELAA